MHKAAEGGSLDVIKFLAPLFGARVHDKDMNSCTVLHWAAQCGHCQVARYLITELKLDPQARDKVCVWEGEGCGMPREGKTCSKVGMGFACLCVVIIEVMFSEQPFYIVVTDGQNKVCTYICVVLRSPSTLCCTGPCLWMYERRVNLVHSSLQMTSEARLKASCCKMIQVLTCKPP